MLFAQWPGVRSIVTMRIFCLIFIITLCEAKLKHGILFNNTIELPKRYAPDWSDLDTRPLPKWYDNAKIGIFLHWGVYSVPSFASEWFWSYWKADMEDCDYFVRKHYPRGFTYQEFAPMFTAEFFDPEKWAKLFAKAGAKYIVLTSKHHEGFTLFPSKRSFSWNAMDIGPKRDLVGDLAAAVREEGMKFGVYHSLYEWFNPIYEEDKMTRFATQTFVDTKLLPDIKQIILDYEPSVFWSDGDWEARDTYWKSTALLAWLYNDSPVRDEIVVNDRWGIGIPGKHGDFYNHADRFNPGVLMGHKWENAFTVDSKSWGYRRNMEISEVLTINQLLQQVVSTVSCGGNALINVGPTKEGTIAAIFQERLLSLGDWLTINGEAIYDTSPWISQNDTLNGDVWYTCTKTTYNAKHPIAKPRRSDTITAVYSIFLKWPADSILKLRDVSNYMSSGNYHVQMLGNKGCLNWRITEGDVNIQLPNKADVKSEHAWSLKITSV